ncbi:patatin-like phospholipase family protein [Methylibium sp. Root1272]|uniref:patatin-like phospholipase family protein n=1 Tax=Methylibium sp. Root1272 TaxID=1736441 RepID=UPI0006FE1841|nr:patatin-like phospholipase family protein [Methylibium sp. Root1272]KQW69849.1 patatin [Methylibium sp. Root1272]
MSSAESNPRIALVLSGGGVRAMVFHLGVLRHLAERGALEHVHRLSSVSGGSLLVGLILQSAGMRWPRSAEFLSTTYPALRDKLCSSSLQWAAARQLLNPLRWRFALSRANLLALALRKHWGVKARLADLPRTPEWSINGTTAETGRRFRFKPESIGDYQLGYAHPGEFQLASALAVSAAFPGGFGPLTLAASRFVWKKRPSWDSDPESVQPVDIGFRRLHLYDGGVYDNLGLEPYFDAGHGVPKHKSLFILVSDAGAPLPTGFSYGVMSPWRLKRVADIMSEQARALRVRTFTSYLQRTPGAGAYVYIGASSAVGGSTGSSQHPALFPTTLRRLTRTEFDLLADHGYQIADAVAAEHAIGSAAAGLDVEESL